ncbi:MAG: peptide ABC transporter substrate-binding protein, partial [Deltaproteobacteria bacterium]
MKPDTIIEVKDLKKYYPITKGLIFSKVVGQIKAVNGISFTVPRSHTFGLVGESGCGKTTTMNLLLGLDTPTSGQIMYEGRDISGFKGRDLFRFRRNVQAVFQDPFRSLNPRKKIKDIISEPLRVHKVLSRKKIGQRVLELLGLVGLSSRHADLYPHEFSGGQRQRIAIARALALNPGTIVLDEPVSALDVSIQAQILNLLAELQEKLGLTYIIIAHNLAVVEHVSTHVGVMYLGQIVEMAPTGELFDNPLHPYTHALLESVPVADPDDIREAVLEGEVPSPLDIPP